MDKDKPEEKKKSEPPKSSENPAPSPSGPPPPGPPVPAESQTLIATVTESQTSNATLARDEEGHVIPIKTSRFKDRLKQAETRLHAQRTTTWTRKPSKTRLGKFDALDLAIPAGTDANGEATGQQVRGSHQQEPGSPGGLGGLRRGTSADRTRKKFPGTSEPENLRSFDETRITFGTHRGGISRPWKTKASIIPGIYERASRDEPRPVVEEKRPPPTSEDEAAHWEDVTSGSEADEIVPLYVRRLSERKQLRTAEFAKQDEERVMRQEEKRDKELVINELTAGKGEGVFGYFSKLGQGAGIRAVLRAPSDIEESVSTRSQPSGDTSGPDKTWIMGSSGFSSSSSSTIEPRTQINLTYQFHMASSLTPILILMWISGRMPWVLRCASERNKHRRMDYIIKKTSISFIIFSFSSIIMALVLVISLASTCHILSRNGTTQPYQQLEILYVQKYWLQYALFIFPLMLCTTFYISILIYGNEMGKYLSDIFASSSRFRCDATKRIWLYGWISLIFLGLVCSYYIANYPNGLPAVRGGATLITITIFHFFIPGIRVNLPVFEPLAGIVLGFQIYVIISARVVMALPVFYSVIIRNLAVQWNFRTALVLKALSAKGDQKLKEIRTASTHRYLFRFHIVITALVRGLSDDEFIPTFIMYFGLQFAAIVLTLYKVSKTLGITFDKDDDEFGNKTKVDIIEENYRDERMETLADASILLFLTLSGFLATSELLAQCSHKVRRGYYHVRRHGINAKHAIDRKFVLSLIECYTYPRPLLLSPGNYIELTRPFIAAFLGGAIMIFSIMIQTESNSLVTTPILGLCEGDVVCVVGFAIGPRKQAENLNENFMKMVDKHNMMFPTTPTTTTTPATTTTTTTTTTTPTTTRGSPTITGPPAIRSGRNMSEHFIRCPFSSVIRQKVYDAKFNEIPIPTSSTLECIGNTYPKGKKYFDAFGNPVTEYDSCGQLKLPLRTNYKSDDPTEPYNPPKTVQYPTPFLFSSDPIAGPLRCWGQNDFNTQANFLDSTMAQNPFHRCGFPNEWGNFFCAAYARGLQWNSPQLNDMIQKEGEKILMGDVGNSGIAICNKDNHNLWVRESPKRDVNTEPSSSLLPTRTIRLLPYNRNGRILRFKGNARYALYPYLHRHLLNPRKPHNYYDCFGIKLDEFDDCGNLPFSITRVDIPKSGPNRKGFEIRRPMLITYTIGGNPYKCWEHERKGFTCGFQGVPGDRVIEQNIPIICAKFKQYNEKGIFNDYIGSD